MKPDAGCRVGVRMLSILWKDEEVKTEMAILPLLTQLRRNRTILASATLLFLVFLEVGVIDFGS